MLLNFETRSKYRCATHCISQATHVNATVRLVLFEMKRLRQTKVKTARSIHFPFQMQILLVSQCPSLSLTLFNSPQIVVGLINGTCFLLVLFFAVRTQVNLIKRELSEKNSFVLVSASRINLPLLFVSCSLAYMSF
jgi:hypothetical protein